MVCSSTVDRTWGKVCSLVADGTLFDCRQCALLLQTVCSLTAYRLFGSGWPALRPQMIRSSAEDGLLFNCRWPTLQWLMVRSSGNQLHLP